MFVVRIIVDDEKKDFKAFVRKEDAQRRYARAWRQTNDGDFRSTAIFEVIGVDDARQAVDAVKRGDSRWSLCLASKNRGRFRSANLTWRSSFRCPKDRRVKSAQPT